MPKAITYSPTWQRVLLEILFLFAGITYVLKFPLFMSLTMGNWRYTIKSTSNTI